MNVLRRTFTPLRLLAILALAVMGLFVMPHITHAASGDLTVTSNMYPADPTAYGGCHWGYMLEIEYKAPGSGWLSAEFDGLSPWPSSVTLTTADHSIQPGVTYQVKANKHCWTNWVCYNWGCALHPIASYGNKHSITAGGPAGPPPADPWTVDTSTAQQLTMTVTRQALADHPDCLFDDLFDIKLRQRGSHTWYVYGILLDAGDNSGSTTITNLTSNTEYILRMYCYGNNAQGEYYMGREIVTVS